MKRQQEGYVLLVALFAVVFLMAAGAMLAASLGYRSWLVREQARDVHLTALTDGALARSLAKLSVNSYYEGTGEEALGEGTIAIAVERTGLYERRVTVTASYGGGRRSARARVQVDDVRPPRVLGWEPVPPPPPG